MATKINVRSPFYLTVTEPTIPTPTFTCDTANIQGLTISKEGVISVPSLEFGQFDSFQVTGQSYSNNKFPTVSTATDRTFDVRILIPEGFANSDDGYLDCGQVVSQPAQDTGVGDPCENGVSASGSISNQTLDSDGESVTIDFSSKFSGSSLSYSVINYDTGLVYSSISGTNLELISSGRAGSTTIIIQATDASDCVASQSFTVTVNAVDQASFTCGLAGLFGGSIAQDGTITNPKSVADITKIKSTSGGAAITSYSANNTGSDRSVTLYFDLTAPAGYSNAGSTIECSLTFNQPASLPTFTCALANLSGQKISAAGSIKKGTATLGTIGDFSPNDFDPVESDTPRDVTFTITIPSGYSNSGTIDCVKTLTQPGELPQVGANTYYLTTPKAGDPTAFCDALYLASTVVTSDATSISNGLGKRIFKDGSAFNGNGFKYGVVDAKQSIGKGTGAYLVWEIDSNGIVLDVFTAVCETIAADETTKPRKFGQL